VLDGINYIIKIYLLLKLIFPCICFQKVSCRGGTMRVLWWLAPLLLGPLAGAMCPPRCECDDAALVVSCEDAQLEVLPIQLNPEVETVRLRGNRISSLEFSMAFYTRLRLLDVSTNRLQNLGPGLFQDQVSFVVFAVLFSNLCYLAPFIVEIGNLLDFCVEPVAYT